MATLTSSWPYARTATPAARHCSPKSVVCQQSWTAPSTDHGERTTGGVLAVRIRPRNGRVRPREQPAGPVLRLPEAQRGRGMERSAYRSELDLERLGRADTARRHPGGRSHRCGDHAGGRTGRSGEPATGPAGCDECPGRSWTPRMPVLKRGANLQARARGTGASQVPRCTSCPTRTDCLSGTRAIGHVRRGTGGRHRGSGDLIADCSASLRGL